MNALDRSHEVSTYKNTNKPKTIDDLLTVLNSA